MIDATRPFNQARSDARDPIRVVVTPTGERYIMQGNHRVYGAQEDSLASIGVIIYTPAEWEQHQGISLPFVPSGTNNPTIVP
jgi:hypothetical protein